MKAKIPPIDLKAEFREIRNGLSSRLGRVLAGGRYVLGEEVREFERRFARFVGVRFAVGVASGSDAILLALMALGTGPGDEVITTPFTFVSTVTAIVRLGARPVFVDIEPETCNLNPDLILDKVTRRTRGILAVHLYGNPCQIDEIQRVARRKNLFVIEDCAQACGATFRGKQVGTFGDVGAFSFYPTKTLGAFGDAGAIAMNSRKLYEEIRSLHRHGEDGKDHSYRHVRVGINSRLDEVQAAVLNEKLKYVAKWNRGRREAARYYDQLIAGHRVPLISIPQETRHSKAVYHQYVIRTPKRDELFSYLKKRGIDVGIYYPIPLHLQPCFRYLGYRKGDFPNTEQASLQVLSLPLYPQVLPSTQKRVISEIKKFVSRSRL